MKEDSEDAFRGTQVPLLAPREGTTISTNLTISPPTGRATFLEENSRG